jgi:hypothetical protein
MRPIFASAGLETLDLEPSTAIHGDTRANWSGLSVRCSLSELTSDYMESRSFEVVAAKHGVHRPALVAPDLQTERAVRVERAPKPVAPERLKPAPPTRKRSSRRAALAKAKAKRLAAGIPEKKKKRWKLLTDICGTCAHLRKSHKNVEGIWKRCSQCRCRRHKEKGKQ